MVNKCPVSRKGTTLCQCEIVAEIKASMASDSKPATYAISPRFPTILLDPKRIGGAAT